MKNNRSSTVKLTRPVLITIGAVMGLSYFGLGVYYNHQNKQAERSGYAVGYKAGIDATGDANQSKLDGCLSRVEQEYTLTFEDNKQRNGGVVPSDVADYIEAQYKDRKDTCFRQYAAD